MCLWVVVVVVFWGVMIVCGVFFVFILLVSVRFVLCF